MIQSEGRKKSIAAMNPASRQLADHERETCPEDECDQGPEHISMILDRLLGIYSTCGVITRRAAS